MSYSPRRHGGHGDFTEASGFSVPLRVLRVSVVNKALEVFSSFASRNFVGPVTAMRLLSTLQPRNRVPFSRYRAIMGAHLRIHPYPVKGMARWVESKGEIDS